jgi:membrane protease YdiL (CAAX protease family)
MHSETGPEAPELEMGPPGTRAKFIAVFAYLALVILGILSLRAPVLVHFLPVIMVALPLFLRRKVHIGFSRADIALGVAATLLCLVPFALAGLLTGHAIHLPGITTAGYQLLAVAFPEETFFRGYLQEAFGNDRKALVITSLLFAAAHLPRAFVAAEWHLVLTFLPSLVMGWLYLRTRNIVPAVIFHFTANMVFTGLGG